ncbi:MAG: isoleucine--tRNA ligase, partial [Candidatus Komeilibacteria bacterium CG_4_9_14_3_um_filter_37_5]
SIKELQEFASEPLADNIDLHRPAIDQVFLRCPHCASGKMSRVKEVMDCWFDSGAMPFAQHHYPFANQELIDQKIQYPANYISEAIDQTRGWFYTLLAISSLLDKGSSYLNVICLGHINDKFGRKMSKSKGNIIDPWQVIDQFGVDAVRLHLYTINQPGEGKNYDLKDVQSVFRQNLMILWNVYEFYSLYAAKSSVIKRPKPTNVLDQWILACLDQLITNVTTALNEYHVYEAAREIPLLINDLSTWYLRRSRDRFKSSESAEALATLEFVLLTLSKVMAPFTPFIAEHLYQQVSGLDYSQANNSVHLATWPELVPVEETVIAEMSRVRKLVELGLAARDQAGIKVRQPLNALLLPADQYLLPAEYQSIVQDELNVKNIIWSDQVQVVTLDVEITPALRKEGYQRELIRQINSLRKKAGLTIADQ